MNPRHWLLAGALTIGATACSHSTSDSNPGDTGTLQLALTSAPGDASCLKVTIAGTRSTTKLIDLTPGMATTYTFKGLPIGIATITGDAFASSCAALASDAVPVYTTDAPVTVRIDPVEVVKVVLKLLRNGRLSIDVDFENSIQPYLVPTAPGIIVKALFTAGDSVNAKPDGTPYRMVGIPDGLGAYDNDDGTFTLLSNHELQIPTGIARAHGGKSAFVSKWTVRKSDLAFLKGEDLIKNVMVFDAATGTYGAPATPYSFSRLCSADLAPVSAFYDAATGLGYKGQFFFSGEEVTDGRTWAHGLDGTSWELARFGKQAWENTLAHPNPPSGLTIVAGDDDSAINNSQVVFYVGKKTDTGNPVEKAGLTNGTLYSLKVPGTLQEPAAGFPGVTAISLVALSNQEGKSMASLDAECLSLGCTTFNRPEDGAWDPSHPSDYYFVTTASFTGLSRLWRVRFTDLTNLAAGGTLEMLLDGTEGQKMFDNITITAGGKIYLLEDVGAQDHIGKVWRYDIAAGKSSLTMVMQHNPAYFMPGAPQFITRDEESSGVIDASAILGPGWFLIDVQAHNALDAELVEGGQYLAFFDPAAK
jgi:hypothetical protein